MELEQAELAAAAAELAVSSTGKQGDDESESGDDSSDEDEELGEEQEIDEEEYKKPRTRARARSTGLSPSSPRLPGRAAARREPRLTRKRARVKDSSRSA